MKASNKAIITLASALCLAAPLSSRAITLGIEPVSQTIPLGTLAQVQVMVSELVPGDAPSLGAFDFTLSYDPTILSFSSVQFGTQLNLSDPFGSWQQTFESIGGLEEVEISLQSPGDLILYQAGTFALVTLNFNTIAAGTSPLDLSVIVFGDELGTPLSVDCENNFSITVQGSVPDAGSTAFCLCLGVLGCLGLRRRHGAEGL